MTVRDAAGTPLAGVAVGLALTGSGLLVHLTQTHNQTVSCGSNVISQITDAAGHAALSPAAVGENESAVPNIQIRANGILLATIRARSLDLACSPSGPGQVDMLDLNEFRLYFLGLKPGLGTDFTDTGASPPGVSAFNAFRTEYLCNASGSPTGPTCSQTQCFACP